MNQSVPDDRPDQPGKAMLLMWLIVIPAIAVLEIASFAVGRYLREHHASYWAGVGLGVGNCVVLLAIVWFASRFVRRYAACAPSPAARRYQRRVLAAAVVYMIALIAAMVAHQRLQLEGPLAYAAAAAPSLPIMAMVAVMGLYLREETDEFQRAVQVEAALWATGGLLALASVWGFLEMFRLAPHVEGWAALPVWAVFLSIGQLIARRRYR